MTKISDEGLWKGNEPSGSITCGEFLDWLRKYYLPYDSVPNGEEGLIACFTLFSQNYQ